MAGRFIFQKFASGMSRSTSRLSAHGSASARATTPVIPRASGARYLNTFPCSREAVKTGMPDSVGGVKPTSSSGASIKVQLTDRAARVKAWWAPNKELKTPQLDTSITSIVLLTALAAVCFAPLPSHGKPSGKVPILHCSGCCICLNGSSKS